MSTSPNLRLPYLDANQNQKSVTHNTALRMLDALVNLRVASASLSAPPASPSDGRCWIVASGGTGAWLGKDLDVAAWQDGAWSFYAPNPGFVAYVDALGGALLWNGTAWVSLLGAIASLALTTLGIGTAADPSNPLSARLNAALFSALPTGGTPAGTGDVRVQLSKQALGNTASLLFQDGSSGRAEIGLAGDDDLHVKVSSDGSTFADALVIAAATGAATFLATPTAPTAAPGDSSTRLATTAFVAAAAAGASTVTSVAGRTGAVALGVGDVSGAAPLAGPTFTGTLLSTGQTTLNTATATFLYQAGGNANIGGGTSSGNFNSVVASLKNSARSVMAWNKSGGRGEMNWLINRGPGSGGFLISDVDNSGSVTDLVGSDSSGNVSIVGGLTVNKPAVSFGVAGGGSPFVYSGLGNNPYFGITFAGLTYGVSGQLPSPAGTSTLGGYYSGLGVGGASANKGQPIFGVLNASQGGSGRGGVAFTVYDTNVVVTFNSTLDDGQGNMAVAGSLLPAADNAKPLGTDASRWGRVRGAQVATELLAVLPSASAPVTAQQGFIYTDSTLTALRWHNGAQWSRVTNFAKFEAYPGSDCYIAAATWTKVAFNNADTNDQGVFTASNSRFTAPEAGVYAVGADLAYRQNNSSAPTALQLAFYKNGAAAGRGRAGATGLVSGVSTVNGTAVLKLAAGDVIEVWAFFTAADGYVAAQDSCFWVAQLP